ncbi:AMP-binding protein [Robbsia andropogonis]|uniref:AMP-binding protein n=1 Tax=Robbsia andropogonis TaxID=28092 RepID=UPI0009E245FD|nr:AMP-binding protein [Robbsia andropogonis]
MQCASTIHRLLEVLECDKGAANRMTFVDDAGNEASISYRDLAMQTVQRAGAMRELGVRQDDLVMLALPASVDHVVTMMACVMLGGLPCTVPIPGKRMTASAKQVVDVACEIYEPRFIFASPTGAAAMQDLATRTGVRIVDDALLQAAAAAGTQPVITSKHGHDAHHVQLTSGSTSYPKAAVLSHLNVVSNVLGIGGSVGFDIERGDGTASWLPLYHDMGLLTLLSNLHYRAPLVMMQPNSFIRNPLGWLKRVAATRATTTSVPTFALRYCVRRFNASSMQNVDLSACRNIFIGGERVDQATLRDFAETFAPYGLDASALQPCYGMAESTLAVSMHKAWHVGRVEGAPYVMVDQIDRQALIERQQANVIGTVDNSETVLAMGTPIHGMEFQIVNDQGHACTERMAGEIAIRGSSVMLGYLNPGNGSIEPALNHSGWFMSGDIGYVSAGQLYILGRKKEIIIIRGSNYFPHEIEETLAQHPALHKSSCIAFGLPDDENGTERLVIAVEARPVDATSKMRSECQLLLQQDIGFAAHDICFVEPGTLPRTTSGKLQRVKCRDLYTSGGLEVITVPAMRSTPTPSGITRAIGANALTATGARA